MSKYFPIYRKRELIVRKGQQNKIYTFEVMAVTSDGKTTPAGHAIININCSTNVVTLNDPENPERPVAKDVIKEIGVVCHNISEEIEKEIFD